MQKTRCLVKIRVLPVLVAVYGAVGLAGLVSPTAIAAENPTTSVTTLVLTNEPPTTTTIPSTVPDSPIGTESIHQAVVRNSKGAMAGNFHASILTVGATPGDLVENRLRTIVFNLKDGQIVATGVTLYPKTDAYLPVNKSVRIAIVGGTGKYLGASGEMYTTRQSNGNYRHVLTLVK